MDKQQIKKHSKFLSLILRHKPTIIGLTLDDKGWADVMELLQKTQAYGKQLDIDMLSQIVAANDKKRFSFSEDGKKIRANQGHSISIDLDLTAMTPPERLYHGTAKRNIQSIKAKGLTKQNRHHVHLSLNRDTAIAVGQRYGQPVVLVIEADRMHKNGIAFYCSANQVWLTDTVAPEYIQFPE